MPCNEQQQLDFDMNAKIQQDVIVKGVVTLRVDEVLEVCWLSQTAVTARCVKLFV